ncbi:MAG TPA: PEGA domain-containing protein [Vicinamibacterales bacterium]|nr:PEGA domain-containing protein [Vicinamibacterales bacterium]
MAANKDAIQRDEHPLAAEPHPIRPTRPLRAPAPPKPSSAFMKLLTFKKAEGPIADFPSEQKVSARTIWLIVAALVGVGLAIALAVLAPRWWAGAPAPQVGQLAIISQPTGAEVIVDQQPRGVTPLTLSLPSGAHTVLLNRGDVSRSFEVNIKAGAEVLHHVDLEPRQLVAQGGQLVVTSDPPGARVSVDGQARGVSPVTVDDLTPGQHAVVIHGESGSVQRTVTVQRGQTASLVVSMGQGGSFGWVSLTSPVVMQIFENDRRLGTSETDRIMMSAGKHTLKIVNTRLGYQRTQVVQVPAGAAASLKVDLPDGVVNLNALPWAEASIDGRRVGDTPLANLKLPIGEHEVVFRNPQFGERRQTFLVTASEPTRVSVDLRK